VIEATSFVYPRWVPQLADAGEVLAALPRTAGVRYPVLVPDEPGLDRTLSAGATEIALFTSATESFARRNLGRTIEESMAMFAPVIERARAEGLAVRVTTVDASAGGLGGCPHAETATCR
jgi:hydroxymethylglutaryl-CoA lyase